MLRKTLIIFTVVTSMSICTALSAQSFNEWKIIHAGTLLADARENVRTEQSIIIRNNEIVEVRDGYVSPNQVNGAANAKVIDLKNQFVMAGLIDSHTHILGQQEPNRRELRVTRSSQFSTLMGVEYGMRTLRAGFTSIRNVGGDRNAIFALRDAINQGVVMGPRIKAAGQGLTPTGGHGDGGGFRDDIFPHPHSGVCDGVAECRKAVRTQIKYGADHIKYVATGGVLSMTATGTGQQFTDEEQIALVQAAHAMGRKVAAHAHGKIGLEAALRAGVDSIEHGSYLDADTADLFVATGAYLVPTLIAGHTVERIASERPAFYTPEVRQKALEVGPVMKAALRTAHEKGVKIAFGTDAGVNDHGTNAYEAVLMNEAGMSERAILISATVNAADLMDLTDIAGTIEAGKDADIIAVSGNPLENISTLLEPQFVMARGNEINLDVPPVDLFPWPNI
ncbi:MAG: amidohydrolase family protein [Gammaproteobacteria bacterium]|jgi:imidazolonepropionase-like amidohydrolase|nr:amidohydrolase family protein [Gammaproteobacteria bacterium]MBT3858454.1 amidohydrolase family protein [Gammaproteobacteria bacterium]MBT3986808.1 amidohydrolase family protein [Gammaproteobacteria bacterium]MBT4256830.1 amidohydrolase family protein [Gammaproteobacteria bacterium]MBT4657627.1 amidohydrolase family protein [Gammaproteobacteria bacterium]